MNGLRVEDFDAFFRELHGPCTTCAAHKVLARDCQHMEPFAWQRELTNRVFAEGWPSTIELPTASGKTAVIDIAVFTLALDPSAARRAPLRVFFVVDRRVVVDEAHRRASRIAAKLANASSGVLNAVAARLRTLGGSDAEPLVSAVLRGGIYREDGWARSPVQPLIAVSTVDQVGSRLLGRGYGVSDGMKPIHQGLVAYDSLIVLDEAHLSEPFRQTLEALHDYAGQADVCLPRRFQTVIMSATPRNAGPRHFYLEDDHPDRSDRRPGRLLQRLEARKQTKLLPVVDIGKPPPKGAPRSELRAWSGDRAKRDSTFSEHVASATREQIGRARCVGVVMNRVGTAREVFENVRGDPSFDAVLLTGRSRPLDRDAVVASIWARARAGRERRGDDRPLVVVATQCIEAGADLDFDALVTECASLDALRQRFGRLDRLGDLHESRATIVMRSDALDDDPVYGEAIGETWRWLQKMWKGVRKPRRRSTPSSEGAVEIDFAHLPNPRGAELEKMISRSREAPILLPAHLDAWAMTSPRPAADPDVALWLHGVSDEVADVQLVWRSDFLPETAERWADIVSLCPPASGEAISVPLFSARAWLARHSPAEAADVVADLQTDNGRTSHTMISDRRALRWCGDDDPDTRLVHAIDVRPGDTLVVPSSWGGVDEFGWLPEPRPVRAAPDLGDRVQLEQRGRATLRICKPLVAEWLPNNSAAFPQIDQAVRRALQPIEEDGDSSDLALGGVLDLLERAIDAQPWLRETARRLRLDSRPRISVHPLGGVVIRASKRRLYQALTASVEEAHSAESDFTSQDDSSSFVSRPVSLARHSEGVGELAHAFASACVPELAADAALAGKLHDLGKADPRFHRWLRGGDEIAAALGKPLAKSGIRNRQERERARVVSGYPKGGRHELLSLALIETDLQSLCEYDGASDPELICHLVASHHGYCRPFAPAFSDHDDTIMVEVDSGVSGQILRAMAVSASRMSRLDSGVSERFWRLLRKYGWLGLSYLESILRLADHRRSELDELEGDDDEG